MAKSLSGVFMLVAPGPVTATIEDVLFIEAERFFSKLIVLPRPYIVIFARPLARRCWEGVRDAVNG